MSGLDVSKLVGDLRQQIDVRRSRGDFTPEDIEALFNERLRQYIADAKIDPRLGDRLRHDSHDWNINSAYRIRTRRQGAGGAVIRFAKRIVRPFVRLYTDHILIDRRRSTSSSGTFCSIRSIERCGSNSR